MAHLKDNHVCHMILTEVWKKSLLNIFLSITVEQHSTLYRVRASETLIGISSTLVEMLCKRSITFMFQQYHEVSRVFTGFECEKKPQNF